ncbi:hypothetical protein [Streptomyces apocyni]|uniref:hypothetical protein n=1 Tax=Streptomyces apocyni TaxID=2654677 RepID=UPI0012EA0400|nr:hypothetical protein [Streptomyces apocyni]
MGEFLHAAISFPTVLFTGALVVVLCFWLLAAFGAADTDAFDGDSGTGIGAAGLGGVPVTVAVSLLTVFAWFTSLVGTVLLDRWGVTGAAATAAAFGVLVFAVLASWRLTRLFLKPLSSLFPDEPPPSRLDFVGCTCTIRTSRVDDGFGQAEVAADDGSTAVVQVRQTAEDLAAHPPDALTFGSTALLYAYDDAGEFFWAAPHPTFGELLDPRDTTA